MNCPAMKQFLWKVEGNPSDLDAIRSAAIVRLGELGRLWLRVFGLLHTLFRRLEDGRCCCWRLKGDDCCRVFKRFGRADDVFLDVLDDKVEPDKRHES